MGGALALFEIQDGDFQMNGRALIPCEASAPMKWSDAPQFRAPWLGSTDRHPISKRSVRTFAASIPWRSVSSSWPSAPNCPWTIPKNSERTVAASAVAAETRANASAPSMIRRRAFHGPLLSVLATCIACAKGKAGGDRVLRSSRENLPRPSPLEGFARYPGASSVQTRVAGGPTLPAASVATIAKLCFPSARGPSLWGETHGSNPPESSRHRKVTLGSLAPNLKRGLGFDAVTPGGGPAEILTRGATLSTVKDRRDGALTLPAAPTALTEKPWWPFESGDCGVKGERHENHGAPRLRRHWKVVPIWLELNLNVGVGSRMSAPSVGPESMLALGALFVAENFANAE